MLTISQKRFFISLYELALFVKRGTWYKIVNDRVGVRKRSKTGICSPLDIGIENQIFLEKPEDSILIPINWFDSCNDSFFSGVATSPVAWRHACFQEMETFVVFYWEVNNKTKLCVKGFVA